MHRISPIALVGALTVTGGLVGCSATTPTDARAYTFQSTRPTLAAGDNVAAGVLLAGGFDIPGSRQNVDVAAQPAPEGNPAFTNVNVDINE